MDDEIALLQFIKGARLFDYARPFGTETKLLVVPLVRRRSCTISVPFTTLIQQTVTFLSRYYSSMVERGVLLGPHN